MLSMDYRSNARTVMVAIIAGFAGSMLRKGTVGEAVVNVIESVGSLLF